MVKEVGSGDIENRTIVFDTMVSNSRSKMGLAKATGARHDKPTIRLSSKCFSCLISASKLFLTSWTFISALREQIVKGEASQRAQVAVSL